MLNYDSTLKQLTEQFITDVIRGVKTVDDFDDYVASWKANGGDKITGRSQRMVYCAITAFSPDR